MTIEASKAALAIMCRESGDNGTAENHRDLVDQFMDDLHKWLTRALILTMPTIMLRYLYLPWAFTLIETRDRKEASRAIAARVFVGLEPRPLPEKLPPNVVELFSQTRH